MFRNFALAASVLPLLIAFAAPANAKGDAQGAFATCVTESSSMMFLPSDPGFKTALAQWRQLDREGVSGPITASAPAPSASGVEYLKLKFQVSQCGGILPRSGLKYNCTSVGCNETIIGLENLPPGSTVTVESCDSMTNVRITTTWTKQADGSFTVTYRNEEQLTQCEPVG